MYLIRNHTFKKSDIDSSLEFITNSAEFIFRDDDIFQIRLGLNKLVQAMSVLYKEYKEKELLKTIKTMKITMI